jgi:hypothetical protein
MAVTLGVRIGRLWDCAADNPGLRRFYERVGFAYVRDEIVPSPDGRRSFRVSLGVGESNIKECHAHSPEQE